MPIGSLLLWQQTSPGPVLLYTYSLYSQAVPLVPWSYATMLLFFSHSTWICTANSRHNAAHCPRVTNTGEHQPISVLSHPLFSSREPKKPLLSNCGEQIHAMAPFCCNNGKLQHISTCGRSLMSQTIALRSPLASRLVQYQDCYWIRQMLIFKKV